MLLAKIKGGLLKVLTGGVLIVAVTATAFLMVIEWWISLAMKYTLRISEACIERSNEE